MPLLTHRQLAAALPVEMDYLEDLAAELDKPFEVGNKVQVREKDGSWLKECKVVKRRSRDAEKLRYRVQVPRRKDVDVDADRLRFPVPRMKVYWVARFAAAYGFPVVGSGEYYTSIVSRGRDHR